MSFDEVDRSFRVSRCEQVSVDRSLDHGLAFHQRKWRPAFSVESIAEPLPGWLCHVVAVRNPEKLIEPLPRREKLRLIAKVPFADHPRCVPLLLEHFRNRCFAWVEPLSGGRKKYAQIFLVHMHVHAPRVATGHQARAGWGADRASGVKVGQAHAFLGHSVENRSGVCFRAEGTDVRIAQIVTEDDDQVWFGGSPIGERRGENCKDGNKEGIYLHEPIGVLRVTGFHAFFCLRQLAGSTP